MLESFCPLDLQVSTRWSKDHILPEKVEVRVAFSRAMGSNVGYPKEALKRKVQVKDVNGYFVPDMRFRKYL